MSFPDEVVLSGVCLIITDRNSKFLGSQGRTVENTVHVLIFVMNQLKIYRMVEGIGLPNALFCNKNRHYFSCMDAEFCRHAA